MTTRHFASLLALCLVTGCSCGGTNGSTKSGSTSTDGGSGTSGGTGTDGGVATTDGGTGTDGGTAGIPPKPTIGTQIDRMGRPAINTALTDPFDTDTAHEDQVKDDYNADQNPSDWVTNWAPRIQQNLAVYDALDGTCGNQIGAAPGAPSTSTYSTLAGILANDMLVLDTSKGTCNEYLAVELALAGGTTPGDCGGRTPTEDVIDVTYSELAQGTTTGVTDGVDSDRDNPPDDGTFPFLGTPNTTSP